MAIFNLFSKRQKRVRGELPDVFVYDQLPNQLRVQIIHIIRDAIGEDDYSSYVKEAYEFINDVLCREYGLFRLTKHFNSHAQSVFNYFLGVSEVEKALDFVEVAFRVIDTFVREINYQYNSKTKIKPDEAIRELNDRFKEHGIGYQYESGRLVRIDSQFMHSEMVKPTLALLMEKIYRGANEEFLKAHEHYRHGHYKECLNEALKSFESVMKAICTKHKWNFNQTDTAKSLIDVCLKKELIPQYLQSQFTSLRSVLESGVPTVRNKLGGHGQGVEITSVTDAMARYALNLAASNILFLVEHEKNM